MTPREQPPGGPSPGGPKNGSTASTTQNRHLTERHTFARGIAEPARSEAAPFHERHHLGQYGDRPARERNLLTTAPHSFTNVTLSGKSAPGGQGGGIYNGDIATFTNSTDSGANGSTGPQTEAITSASSAFNEVSLASCAVTTDQRGQLDQGLDPAVTPVPLNCGQPPGYDLAGSDGGSSSFQRDRAPVFSAHCLDSASKSTMSWALSRPIASPAHDLVGSDGSVFVSPTGQSSEFLATHPFSHAPKSRVVPSGRHFYE